MFYNSIYEIINPIFCLCHQNNIGIHFIIWEITCRDKFCHLHQGYGIIIRFIYNSIHEKF
jgi:hypothetical protein